VTTSVRPRHPGDLSPARLSSEQARKLRKLVALRGNTGAMAAVGCGIATLDALHDGVAQARTVARVAARLDAIDLGKEGS
jgi:hypothetical protein